jgi:hypothetical protein
MEVDRSHPPLIEELVRNTIGISLEDVLDDFTGSPRFVHLRVDG